MPTIHSHPNPLPHFDRPSEAVVYWTLENLCGGSGGRYMLPLRKLAQHCNLSVSTVNRAILALTKRKLIQYRPGTNQAHSSIFECPYNTGETVSPQANAVAKTAVPLPSDSDSHINDVSIGDDHDIGPVFHKQNEHGNLSPEERLAYQVAGGLDDLQNLKLYQSYCRKYPAQLILKAYIRAREPSPDQIRKSRGALFNFLVQRYAK